MNVFLTIDTETSIGGAFNDDTLKPVGHQKRIYGENGEKTFGIPLIMDISDQYGLKTTFFVEVFNSYYFGSASTKYVCDHIMNRGHDIQLHIHPNYLNFTLHNHRKKTFSDLIGTYNLAKQIELIEAGKHLLQEMGVSHIIAFRAGCFGADFNTFKSLKKNGIYIDSSYNRAFLGETCMLGDTKINDLAYISGVWEFPVTNFIEASKLRRKRFMPLDINAVSFHELKSVLGAGITMGIKNITIILHSFSFLKHYDIQYQRVRPRWPVIHRFEKLCKFLAENSDRYKVRTFGSLDEKELTETQLNSSHTYPLVPTRLSLLRGLEQLKEKFY